MGERENVAVVRAIFEEFEEGRSDTAFEFYDESIVWDGRRVPFADLGGVYYGHDGVRKWWRAWLSAWERIELLGAPEQRTNGNQVVSIWKQRNRGKGSGAEVTQETALLWTFEGGRIVRVAVYVDVNAALQAAGIEDGARQAADRS